MPPSEQFKGWRKAKKLTLSELAEKLGVNPSTLSRIERGLSQPHLRLAARIAKLSCGAVPVKSWIQEDAA